MKPLKEVQVKLTSTVEHIQTTKLEVEAQKNSAINFIKTSFKELHDILDKRERDLMEEAGAVVQEKVNKLSVQEKTL